jgi:predicted AlkP superfamily phosphohydrolase/phosphomutase
MKARGLKRGIALASALAALAVALIAVLVPGCAPEARHPTKVILVGIDAADWTLIDPLLSRGKLPNFAKLVSQGATGKLATLLPLQKSPIIWTSIATGTYPDKHGIGGFTAPAAAGDSVPYTGNVRRVKAIWNILGEKGLKVAVVGWWVTWPAEPVNGYLVSDYIQYENEKGIKLEHQTYPESLFKELDPLRLTEADVSDQAIAGIYPISVPADAVAGLEWVKGYVKMVYAIDETFKRIGLALAGRDVQFLTVYFQGIDSLCHSCWGFRGEAGAPLEGVIDNYYVWMDKVLGEYIDLVDDHTLLVVVSDHGFRGPWHTDDGALLLGVEMHRESGIVGFMGKGVRGGARIPDADVLDITPTILYALGLPVARDMDGGVLIDAFQAGFLKSNRVEFVPTYETGERRGGQPVRSPVDDKVKKKLKALGYIE